MLIQNKKHVSCLSLLADLKGFSLELAQPRTPAIPIPGRIGFLLSDSDAQAWTLAGSASMRTPGPKTPMYHPPNGSPETEYFRAPPPRTRHTSRWKEDWEELELLVSNRPSSSKLPTDITWQGRGAFGSVVKARNKIDSRIYAGIWIVSSSIIVALIRRCQSRKLDFGLARAITRSFEKSMP